MWHNQKRRQQHQRQQHQQQYNFVYNFEEEYDRSSRGLDESTPLFFEGTTSSYDMKILTPDLSCLRRIEFSHIGLNNF